MKKRFMSILLTLCIVLTLLPATAWAANNHNAKLKEGLYYIRCMGNYLNLDANGNAELRDKTNAPERNTKFLVHYYRTAGFGLETEDGRYLGIADDIKNGVRAKAIKKPYLWNTYPEKKDYGDRDSFSLRPSTNTNIILNVSGQKFALGTHIILWEYPKMDAPSSPYLY